MPVSERIYGKLSDGREVKAYTLSNGGVEVEVLSYGAIISSLRVPDGEGAAADIVLGFGSLADWQSKNAPYLGAIVGRVGNRIKDGKFSLEGKDYTLAKNNGGHHLHGGDVGFDKKIWEAKVEGDSVTFALTSPDGEENYPGTVKASVKYELTPEKHLRLSYTSTSDKATPINMTNHSYFNLSGAGSGSIGGQTMELNASKYVATTPDLIPTGELAPVEGTPLDFRKSKPLGQDLSKVENGYDHCFVIDREGKADGELAFVARAADPVSGRTMEVYTTEPGVQLYTGGFLGGEVGREGSPYLQYAGFCLETQHFPDSINQPSFPSIVLRPGETRTSTTEFRF